MNLILKSALLAASVFFTAQAAQAQQISIDAARFTRPVLGDTINFRAANGAPAIEVNAALGQAAQQYAEFLARTNTVGHVADGRSVTQRIVATNAYQPCFSAENVFEYWSQPSTVTPPHVVTAALEFWKNSPGHRANLLDPRARHTGVGVAAWTHSGRHYYKVVQVFASDRCSAVSSKGVPPRPVLNLCSKAYVVRQARPTDIVCVPPASRARVVEENRLAASRVQPGGGAYGPNTCRMGYVWREAFVGDAVCVTPDIRALVREENRLGPMRRRLPTVG